MFVTRMITSVAVEKLAPEIAPKKRRARKPYKRFSPTRYTFLVTQFEPDSRERGFFNSHVLYHAQFRTVRLLTPDSGYSTPALKWPASPVRFRRWPVVTINNLRE